MYRSLVADSHALSSASLASPMAGGAWAATRAERREQWLRMLGLSPLPERTDLQATVTGTLERGDYVIEKIHFQSCPGAYVAGNLYRPARITEPLPGVLYLCGHTKGKVNPPYQAHPRWFGQHGYVALVLDPIQLGEGQGFHAGTIFRGWFDWYSRGYTPEGIEVWNAMRAVDYLEARGDVDMARVGVTGLSGGGAMSWFLAAADERIRCAVPVCQTGTIEQHAVDRTVDGHCDCAFWINYHRWCTPDLGALIAPRPLLVAAGTEDIIWRPYAFREVMLRIAKQYRELGAAECCELVEDVSPHGYTPKLRRAIFTWFERHLKGSTEPVDDDVTAGVEAEEDLLVFGGEPPADSRMKDVERWFIPVRTPLPPASPADAAAWRTDALSRLRALTFRHTVPSRPPRLFEVRQSGSAGAGHRGEIWDFETDDGIELRAHLALDPGADPEAPLVLLPQDPDRERVFCCQSPFGRGMDALTVDVRGTGATAMGAGLHNTARRLYMNLGYTLPERQVHDLLAALALVRSRRHYAGVTVYGRGEMAPQAIYAAVLCPEITRIVIEDPPASHEDADTAEFLGVLQTGDLPHNLALVCPRPITLIGRIPDAYEFVERVYEAFGKQNRIHRTSNRESI